MNVKPAYISLLTLAWLPMVHAQESSCPNCAAKDQLLSELRAEIQTLKGEAPVLPTTLEAPPTPADSSATYTVEPGDSLIKIARKAGCSTSDLATLNGLTLDSVIRAGQTLKLPATNSAPVAANQTPAEAPSPAAPAPTRSYKIQEGDTYYSISKRLNIPLDDLIAANPKVKPTQLYAGRTIQIPTGPAPSANANTPAVPAPTNDSTAAAPPPAQPEEKIRAIMVDEEISFGAFATKHGTDIERLNSLNDLSLTSSTILAKGSELYVPAQP